MSRNFAFFKFARNKLVYSAALILAIALFSYGAFGYKQAPGVNTAQIAAVQPSPVVQAGSTINTEDLLEGGSTIVVSDTNSPNQVSVEFLVLEKSGFIVISKESQPTQENILGVSEILTSGQYKNKTIDLKSEIVTNTYATLFEDNGDGSFSIEDKIVKDEEGETVQAEFKMISTPPSSE